jgi:hypothetical protein
LGSIDVYHLQARQLMIHIVAFWSSRDPVNPVNPVRRLTTVDSRCIRADENAPVSKLI